MRVEIKDLVQEEVPIYKIFLDGDIVGCCYAANEEEGWVEVFDRERFVKEHSLTSGLDPLDYRIRLQGKVKIIKDKNSML